MQRGQCVLEWNNGRDLGMQVTFESLALAVRQPDSQELSGFKQPDRPAHQDFGIRGARCSALARAEVEWHRQWADKSSLLHAMLEPSPFLDGTVPDYRFGLEIVQRAGQDVVFHSGGLWGFNTLILRLPQTRMSIIHLANCPPAEPDMDRLVDAALADSFC
jgi:hypothetical protein